MLGEAALDVDAGSDLLQQLVALRVRPVQIAGAEDLGRAVHGLAAVHGPITPDLIPVLQGEPGRIDLVMAGLADRLADVLVQTIARRQTGSDRWQRWNLQGVGRRR